MRESYAETSVDGVEIVNLPAYLPERLGRLDRYRAASRPRGWCAARCWG